MSVFQVNETVDTQNEDGIWLDYSKDSWIFFIKDGYWDSEELQHVRKGEITLSFIQKGIVDAFLLEIFDCLETSDIPFCIKDADHALLESFSMKKDYSVEICILNEKNVVLCDRELSLLHANSQILKEKLLERMNENYDSSAFDAAYQKLMLKYEPYELEEFSVFVQKDRG